jgi:uncharacterized damage-inducible protein DinB
MEEKKNILIKDLVKQLNDIQKNKLWMGDNFEKKLNSLSAEQAFIRPLEKLNSVAQIIAHLSFWNRDLITKLNTGEGVFLESDKENWNSTEELQKQGWSTICENYQSSLDEVIKILNSKDDSFLKQVYYDQDFKQDFTYDFVLNGALHHHLYHLGQLGIVIKLIKIEHH